MNRVLPSRFCPVSVPIVIIGGGACGLVAALAAHDAGAKVLVIERDALTNGSTALSSGLIPASGTRWQKQSGVADCNERFERDINRKGNYEADPVLVSTVCAKSADTLEWLADRYRLNFVLIQDFLYPGHSAYRMHAHPSKTGKGLIDELFNAAVDAGIDFLCSSQVTALFAEPDGLITGVEITRPDGTKEDVGCDTLILACNGFGGNPSLVSKYIPEMAGALFFGHTGNQGDAIIWGKTLGADLKHLGAYQGHGSVATPHNILITWAIIMEGGIQLNENGVRFSNEQEGYSEQSVKVLAQPGRIVWNVYDTRMHNLALQFEDYKKANQAGAVKVLGNESELASTLGVPLKIIENSLSQLKNFSDGEQQCPFGRDFKKKLGIAGPPFYVVRVTGALFHTQGGLSIDEFSRVLRPNDSHFPNLFAAGGAAVSVSGSGAGGYLSGNGLLTAICFGRIAGENAANLIQ